MVSPQCIHLELFSNSCNVPEIQNFLNNLFKSAYLILSNNKLLSCWFAGFLFINFIISSYDLLHNAHVKSFFLYSHLWNDPDKQLVSKFISLFAFLLLIIAILVVNKLHVFIILY